MNTCTEAEVDPWGYAGHACTLPLPHVFEATTPGQLDPKVHRCSCGYWWYDLQQVAEARANA